MPSRTLAPDQSVLQSLASGDAEAVRELFRRHSGSLYALAYGLLPELRQRLLQPIGPLVLR